MSFRDMYFTEEPFSRQCSGCGQTFRKEESFHVHRSCYPSHLMLGKRIRCSSCSYTSPVLQSVQQHVRQKHLPPKFTCIMAQTSSSICGQKFASKLSVLSHVEKHFRYMQTGTTRKRTAVSTDTDTDTETDTESEDEELADKSDEPVSQPECVTASPEKGEPAPAPQSVSDGSEPDDLMRISLTQLLDQLLHCNSCNGYFVTDDDLRQHYYSHSHVPERDKANRRDCDPSSKCENGEGDHKRQPVPDLVANESRQSDTITLD